MSESKIQEPLWHFAGPGREIKDHQNHRDPSRVQGGIRGRNRIHSHGHQSRGKIRRDHNLETDRARDPGIGARVVRDHGGKQLGVDG